MILVVGSTGQLGLAICQRLRDQGLPVRALVRPTSDLARVNTLRSIGVNIVRGNLKDRFSLDAACHKVSTIISTATITMSRQPDDTIQNVDQAGQLNLIDAAKVAGVAQFIYVSYSKNLKTPSPLTTAKRTVEQTLMQSGMNYTILRPSFFMEVWLSPAVGFDFLNAKATIYGDGQLKINWISRDDVAAMAVTVLNHPEACNTILELGGPDALSPLEVVRVFEQAMGQPFEVQHVPAKALHDQQAQATDSVQQSFSALMQDYANGDIIDMSPVRPLAAIPWRSVRSYAQQMLVEQ